MRATIVLSLTDGLSSLVNQLNTYQCVVLNKTV